MPTGPFALELIVALAALVALTAPQRRGLAGVLVLALAFAGLVVAGSAEWASGELTPRGAGVGAGVVLVGLGLFLLGAEPLARPAPGARRHPVWWLGLLAVMVAVGGVLWPLVRQGGALVPIGTAAVVMGVVLVVAGVGQFTQQGRAIRWLERRLGETDEGIERGRMAWLQAGLAALAVVLPHLHLFMGAVLAVTVIGGFAGSMPRRAGRIASAVVAIGALGFAWWYFARVAAGTPLALSALGEGPFSPAFEVSAALPLVIAGWVLLGLFPFHRAGLGLFAALAGAALFVRLLAVAVPTGLEHWQPVIYPLAAIAAWHAAELVDRRRVALAVAVLGLASGAMVAQWAGMGLVTLATGAALIAAWPASRHRALVRVIIGVAGAALVLPILTGGVAVETLATILAVSGAAVAAWRAAPVDGPAPTSSTEGASEPRGAGLRAP